MNFQVFLLIIFGGGIVEYTRACEEFQLHPKDGSVIVSRSLEFDVHTPTNIVTEPKDTMHVARVPSSCRDNKVSLKWKNNYDVMKQKGSPPEVYGYLCIDAMNSAGLSVSSLYMSEQYTVYPPIKNCANAISHFQVPEYITSLYGNVSSLEADINAGRFPFIWAEEYVQEDIRLHWSITDETGKSIVFEYKNDGSRRTIENSYGVITNDPNYEWHIEHARMYIGMLNMTKGFWPIYPGLPGDYGPPSRFIRTIVMSHFSDQPKTAIDGVNLAIHILNALDIPKGISNSMENRDYTMWSVVKDLTNKCEYYRDYEDQSTRRVCLHNIPSVPAYIPFERNFMDGVKDLTNTLKPFSSKKVHEG